MIYVKDACQVEIPPHSSTSAKITTTSFNSSPSDYFMDFLKVSSKGIDAFTSNYSTQPSL